MTQVNSPKQPRVAKPFITTAYINKMLAAYEAEADRRYEKRDSIAYLCHFIAEYNFGAVGFREPLKAYLDLAIKDLLGSYKLTLWVTEDWYDGTRAEPLTMRDKSTIRANLLHFLLLDFATNGPQFSSSN